MKWGSLRSTYALNYNKHSSISHSLINQSSYIIIQNTTIFFLIYAFFVLQGSMCVIFSPGSFTLLAFSYSLLNAQCARNCCLVQHWNIKIEVIYQFQQKFILEPVLLTLYMHEVGRLTGHSTAFSYWWPSDLFLSYFYHFRGVKITEGFWLYLKMSMVPTTGFTWTQVSELFLNFHHPYAMHILTVLLVYWNHRKII